MSRIECSLARGAGRSRRHRQLPGPVRGALAITGLGVGLLFAFVPAIYGYGLTAWKVAEMLVGAR